MIVLKHVKINKYKSYTVPQEVSIESDITALVGKNESGKTGFLEALAKFNYIHDDPKFKFNTTLDYPRSEKKKFDKESKPVVAITCTFIVTEELKTIIGDELGKDVLDFDEFTVQQKYEGGRIFGGIKTKDKKYINFLFKKLDISIETQKKLKSINQIDELYAELKECDEDTELESLRSEIKQTVLDNCFENWNNSLESHIAKEYISPNLPKFWYFDEYYNLPGRINLSEIHRNRKDSKLTDEENKTAKALIELAGINLDDLVSSSDFEEFISELEATSNEITDRIFEYWSTNKNLEIVFAIDTERVDQNRQDKILDIRVKNLKHRITLPLQNRSKGFNWFFSFAVWFSKMQTEEDNSIILLLDEPGLNLHAKAQADLLNYIENLSQNYQIIYTTHSPFMVDSGKLHRTRTVLDGEKSSTISESIQERDPDTLFPLQAALGYDIAQNLFVAKNNLLVEGPADLIYLTYFSGLLKDSGMESLVDEIVITPIGGMDKVATFISLLRASNLKIVTLLDSFPNQKGKQKIDDLIKNKIIKEKNVLFFHDFVQTDSGKADIEDMFLKEEYLKLYNNCFASQYAIGQIDSKKNILDELNRLAQVKRFNHYLPAKNLLTDSSHTFSQDTKIKFENMFKKLNELFS